MSVLYGEWVPEWQTSSEPYVDNSVILARDADMGHKLDIIHWYADYENDYADYQHYMVEGALDLGRIPMVSAGFPIGYSDTAHLQEWARGMAMHSPKPIFIRLMWEFNDPECGGNGDFHVWPQCGHTPADLVATWRYIVNTMRAIAPNLKFIWNPDGTMGSAMYGDSNGSVGAAYPGDAYVDWRGFDSYVYNNQSQYDTENRQTGSSVPMLLGEIGGQDPGAVTWINDLSARLNDGRMGQVGAIVWFSEDPYTFAANPQLKTAVKAMLQTAAFTGKPTPPPTVKRKHGDTQQQVILL